MTANGNGKRPGLGRRNPYADAPYAVGKGKPPVAHRFRKGAPSPNAAGRPKGSTRKSYIERLLAKRVTVTGPDGRRIRKSVREVIDHKLVEKAADGDLKAIKLIHDIVVRYERLGLLNQPTAEELLREAEEEQRKAELSMKLANAYVEHLEFFALLKGLGILVSSNDRLAVAPWVREAAEDHERKQAAEHRHPWGGEPPPG